MSENVQSAKKGGLDGFFGISERKSTMRTEILAGITTFMAMAYILMVNADMFKNAGSGVTYGAAYIATAIAAVVGTMLMAILARMPLAQASGMGVNAFIVFTLINFGKTGLTYANTMMFVLLDGLIFVLLTATGLRKKIFEAIPDTVKIAVPVGIGLFIAFIGFQNAGVIVGNPSTLVSLVSFNFLKDATYGGVLAPVVALVGVLLIAILAKKNVKGSILWGILGSAALYYAMAGIGCIWKDETCLGIFARIAESFEFNPFKAFVEWGEFSFFKVFTEGFNYDAYLAMEGNNAGTLIVLILTTALSLCMVDMFDTLGTLYGACSKGGLLDENGNPLNVNKCMLADSIATCTGAICGTSTVTTFVESSAGVSAGGRTGMTAFVTAICFLFAMFLSPIAQLIPSAATASALIYVGVLMMSSVKNVEWNDPAFALPAFLTIAIMAFGYNISFGIGIGILSHIIVKVCTGKVKEISVATWIIGVLFLAMFVLTN
ncbi:MAG: NCS2 family permease [Clostridia bacterium]|nr:NCS2 family permease [Clostridia bacterium]